MFVHLRLQVRAREGHYLTSATTSCIDETEVVARLVFVGTAQEDGAGGSCENVIVVPLLRVTAGKLCLELTRSYRQVGTPQVSVVFADAWFQGWREALNGESSRRVVCGEWVLVGKGSRIGAGIGSERVCTP